MPPSNPQEWNERYLKGELPWDSRLPSRELVRVIEEEQVAPCRVIELGCGAGTNAIYLAQRGFTVTAVDLAPAAIEMARQRAEGLLNPPQWLVADVTRLPPFDEPFDLLFDRGCYHCIRSDNLAGYLQTLEQISRPGTRFLLLTGNANEQTEFGPPRVHEEEIRTELGPLFEIHWIRPFRFQDADGSDGPLAWSCWMTRRV